MLVRSRWAPMELMGIEKKGWGSKVPPEIEAKIGGPAWLDRKNLRRRGADASRALQTFVPESAVVRHRESVIAGVSEKTSRHRDGKPREPKDERRQQGREAQSRQKQNRKGPVTPFRATVAPSRAWRGSRFRVDRATLRSLPPAWLGSGGRHRGCEGDVRPSRRRVESFLWTSFRCFSGQRRRLGCDRDRRD